MSLTYIISIIIAESLKGLEIKVTPEDPGVVTEGEDVQLNCDIDNDYSMEWSDLKWTHNVCIILKANKIPIN